MRKSPFFLVVMLTLALAIPAFAAVENVKLSGDITVRGIYKDKYGLGGIKHNDTVNGGIFNSADSFQKFFMAQTRLRVNADLTDHVSGEIELMNQRDIDPPNNGGQGSGLTTATAVGASAGGSAGNDQFDVILNLANITIKELYYPELTLKIGRQNMQWGEGFVLGNQQLGNPDPSNTIAADEFSLFNSFDAIRAMVERGVWHYDAFVAKIKENAVNRGDDETAFGVNIGRTFTPFQSEGEVYFITDYSGGPFGAFGETFTRNEDVHAIGTRGSIHPWDRLKLSGETVFEWGKEGGSQATALGPFTPNGTQTQHIVAWAFDFRGEWDWKELPWPATLGTEWVFYSGEEATEGDKSGAYRPLFRGKFHSAIREFQGQFYQTDVSVTPGFTNEHELIFDASFHPFNNKDLTFFSRWLIYWLDEVTVPGRDRYLGNELDMTLKYDYTEDLSFKLINAYFFPGNYFDTDAVTTNAFNQSTSNAQDAAKLVAGEVVLAF